MRARAADGWGRDGVEAVADALNLPADDPARQSVEALQTSLAQAGALEQAAALPFVVGCEPDPRSVEKVKEAYERRKATPMAGEVGRGPRQKLSPGRKPARSRRSPDVS